MSNKISTVIFFDLSFTEFITPRILKVFFIVGAVFAAIGLALAVCAAFIAGPVGKGVLFLILSPVAFLLYVLLARVLCEMIIVAFRIAENTSRLVDQKNP